jgi:alpha-galactosidase
MWKRIVLAFLSAASYGADLTGNWVVSSALNDGTYRRSYFDLKQDDGRISGHIRVTQFYYTIGESTGGPDGFTIAGTLKDGDNVRRVKYEGKLVGEELKLSTKRRPEAPLTEFVAHRAPAGEGAYPSRLPLPALTDLPANGLAKTPPMGWNSWNKFGSRVDDASVRAMADAMVSSGMKDAGYVYVNIDDTWQGERDAKGNIHPNKKFPDMKALAGYVHSKGLKLGIYSSPGPNTCAGYEGSHGHEAQDAKTYAAWGIDYLKYDWCGARNLYTDAEMRAVYQKMGQALQASGRPILYSLCQYGRAYVWEWGAKVGGNAWRTTGDIKDTWDSMSNIGFNQSEIAQYAGPGHWNDPDMLEIGNGGMNEDEYRTHMSLWAISAAPLLAGNDLRTMTPAIKEILTNREVIAVDQDKAGKQGMLFKQNGEIEIFGRRLDGADRAVGVFNRSAAETTVKLTWTEIGFNAAPAKVRDLWAHADAGGNGPAYSIKIPPHGVVLLRVTP